MATGGLYGNSAADVAVYGNSTESAGLYGNTTVFGGSYFEWFIFQVVDVQPATPTGGTWDFTTNTGTAPAGWMNNPPANPLNTVWVSIGLVSSKNTNAIVWGTPGKFSFASGLPVLSGNGVPGSGVGVTDQLYLQLDTTPFSLYFKSVGTWTKVTGSSLFVDLTSNQTIAGVKTFSSQIQGSVSGSAGSISGTLAVANGGTGVTTSTGTGNTVLSNSPTLVTPALGTPTALVGTNITGTASGLTAGNVTTNANLTGDVTSVGNATTLTNAPVIAKVLTGYVSAAGTVAATDSILQAIQKLNGNDATNANLTGPITSVGNATSVASQTGTGSKFVMDSSPTLITPVLGVAVATSINANTIGAGSTSGTNTGDNAINSSSATAAQGANADAFRVDEDVYGLMNQTETTMTFVDGTNTFTLAPTGSTWSYYRTGVKYTITGSKSVTLPASSSTTTLYFIYIDATDGTLTQSTTPWTLNDTKVLVATVARNSTLTPTFFVSEERHTCKWLRRDHMYEHYTSGTQYSSGGALTGPTVGSSTNSQKTCAVAIANFFDEDIYEATSALAAGDGSTNLFYSVFYRTASAAWSWQRSLVPFKYTGAGAIEWDNNGVMTAAGAGSGANTRWVNYYLALTNVSGQESIAWIPGRAAFTSLAAAQAESFAAFTITGFPCAEIVAIWQLTWDTNGTGLGLCRLAANPVKINSNFLTSTATVSATHNGLAGLQGGTINEYYHLTLAEYTGTGTGNFVRATSPTLVTPILGTPTSGDATNLTNTIAPQTHAATSKVTPVDADELPLSDSAASFGLKKLTWANLKATVKTYFDTLYLGIAATASNASQLLGATWASPAAIGSTTPAAGSFTTLSATGNITNTAPINTTSSLTLTGSGAYNSQLVLNSAGGGSGQVTGNGSVIINAATGNAVFQAVNYSNITQTSSTGFAVTGTLSSTGAASLAGVTIGGATPYEGSILNDATNGFQIRSYSGSTTYDFTLLNGSGAITMRVPHGTTDIEVSGNIKTINTGDFGIIKGTLFRNGTANEGSVTTDGTSGLVIRGLSGATTNEFELRGSSGASVMRVLTGTQNVVFNGNLTGIVALTTSGTMNLTSTSAVHTMGGLKWAYGNGTTSNYIYAGTSNLIIRNQGDNANYGYFDSTGLNVVGALTTAGIKEDGSGNVGIGVTPSAWGSNFKVLELPNFSTRRAALFAGSGMTGIGLIQNAYNDNTNHKYIVSGLNPSRLELDGNGGFNFFGAASGTAGNAITWTLLAGLDSSGNLTPGTNSTQAFGSTSLRWNTAYVNTGISFPATQSASADANTLDDYREATYTATATGMTTSPTGTVTFVKVGNNVNMEIPAISGTSNATTFTLTGGPTTMRPSAARVVIARVKDNTGAFVFGLAQIETTGVITLFKDAAASGFTASGTKATAAINISYVI